MRLLHAVTFEFHEFLNNPPAYAILSHAWGNDYDEVSYRDIIDSKADSRLAWRQKVVPCAKKAIKDGYSYIWVDTCCIDKSNLTELTESINSMYRWYQHSQVCYVLWLDVTECPLKLDSILYEIRWFTRGWTLQELLAPKAVQFFNSGWNYLGSRDEMALDLWTLTGIEVKYLTGAASIKEACVAERMFWASRRETKKPEDRAYSLLGVFDLSMPAIYGEGGERAFQRLQEQIIKRLPDDSILAWGYDPLFNSRLTLVNGAAPLLAQSPSDFMFCSGFTLREDDDKFTINPTPTCITNVTTSIFQLEARMTQTGSEMGFFWLNCRYNGSDMSIGTVPIAWQKTGPYGLVYRPQNWSIGYSEPQDTMEEMPVWPLYVHSHSELMQPVAQPGTFSFEWNAHDMEIMSKSPESAWDDHRNAFVFESGPAIMAVRFCLKADKAMTYVVIVVSPTRQFNESTRWLVMEEADRTSLGMICSCWSDFSRKSQEDSFRFGNKVVHRKLSMSTSYIKSEARYIFGVQPGPPECQFHSTFFNSRHQYNYLLLERKIAVVQWRIDPLEAEKKRLSGQRERLGQLISLLSGEKLT